MTDIFVPEVPPLMQSPDGRILAEYLNRQMLSVASFLKATYAGHAGLFISAPAASVLNITPIPQKITGFDSQQPGETGALSIIANDTIQFLETGVWFIGMQAQFEVAADSGNQTREIEVQFYDETASTPSDILASASIPRYGVSATLTGSILVNIPETLLNHEFALYVYSPSGHTISVTQTNLLDYYTFRVSNYTHTGV